MAVGAEKPKVGRSVVVRVPVDVIQLKRQRQAVVHGRRAADVASRTAHAAEVQDYASEVTRGTESEAAKSSRFEGHDRARRNTTFTA